MFQLYVTLMIAAYRGIHKGVSQVNAGLEICRESRYTDFAVSQLTDRLYQFQLILEVLLCVLFCVFFLWILSVGFGCNISLFLFVRPPVLG